VPNYDNEKRSTDSSEYIVPNYDNEKRSTDSSEYIVPSYEPVSPKFSFQQDTKKNEERSTDSSEYIVPNYDNEKRSTDSSEYIVPNYDNELPGLKLPSASYENSANSPEYAPYSPAPIDYDYDPNATPLNIFNSPKSPNSPEYAPYSPAPIDYDNNPSTPYIIDSSSEKRIPSPHTPNHPPPGKTHPILGGNNQNRGFSGIKSDISKLSQEQQHKLLDLLKKKRDELNKKGGSNKNTHLPTIFDVDEVSDDTNEGQENQGGGTRKITF